MVVKSNYEQNGESEKDFGRDGEILDWICGGFDNFMRMGASKLAGDSGVCAERRIATKVCRLASPLLGN